MDCNTGEIFDGSMIDQLIKSGAIAEPKRFKPMQVPPTARQVARKPPRIRRNEPCPCGSGLKFKKCCLRDPADERFAVTPTPPAGG